MLALLPIAAFLLQAQPPQQPAPLNLEEVELQMRRFALVYATVEEESVGKVNPDQAFYIGALPAYAGIPYQELLDQVIQGVPTRGCPQAHARGLNGPALALARHEQKKATRYTRD